MHSDNKQPNGQPSNGAVTPGPAAKPPLGSALAAASPSSTSAASPRSQSPTARQQQPAAPSSSPAAPVAPENGTTSNRPVAAAPAIGQPQSSPHTRGDNPAASPLKPKRPPRQYFIPGDVVLPRDTQLAMDAIVAPCYELVMSESDPVGKALTASFTAESALAILTHQQLLGGLLGETSDPQELEKLFNRHDKGVKRQALLAGLLARFKSAQEKKAPWPN
jgi:hypothetical protein